MAAPAAEAAGADLAEMFRGAEYISFGGSNVLTAVGMLHAAYVG